MSNTLPQPSAKLLYAASDLAQNPIEDASTSSAAAKPPRIQYSLAQWSLHRGFQTGKYKPVEFAEIAKSQFGLNGIEYVNQFYRDTLSSKLIEELHQRAKDQGVKSLLMMIDNEGALGNPDTKARKQSVLNHHKWADAAHLLGCHSIRVNAQSVGSYSEQLKAAVDGLNQLAEYCSKLNLNVLVENHGGLSSNGRWLAEVIKTTENPRVGILPDFGNFTIDKKTGEKYNMYQGIKELMPYAKAVSAKSYSFDQNGLETHIDYFKMMQIVNDANYSGWIGIEFEGEKIAEEDGVKLTHALLQRAESPTADKAEATKH